MKVQLTDLVVQNLRPPVQGQRDVWDGSLPGFGVRVSQGGTKTFVVLVHRNRKAIGRYPQVTLKQARTEAKRLLLSGALLSPADVPSLSYPEAVDQYLEIKREDVSASTLRDYERILRRFRFVSAVDAIRPYQIADAIDAIKGKTDKTLSFTVLKGFFGWCVRREYCKENPMQNLKKPRVPAARERVLDDEELAAIWQASMQLDKYGAIIRLLMLTGQRCGQIDRLQNSWVRDDHIAFPGEVMKNEREHWCPIGPLTKFTLLEVVPVGDYYFSPMTKVGRPFTAWSKNKKRLDAIVQLDPWRHHDLRRTWATNAARLDVPPHVVSRVLSHTAPEGGLAKIYNRHQYRQEMKVAMEKMDDFIAHLVLGSEWPDPIS